MSGQTFSFPPPPPPPPKRVEYNPPAAQRGRGGSGFSQPRGRGSGFGRGTGRGLHSGRGGSRGEGRGAFTAPPSQHGFQGTQPHRGQRQPPFERSFNSNTSHRGKRDYNTAFNQDATRKSRPHAPPAVPSFMADIADLLPAKPVQVEQKEVSPPVRSKNTLGLTPAAADLSESEDDEGEEAKLASNSDAISLEFSHRDHATALRTPAEIAAWIAERKRRYPTEAKREAARKAAEEKHKKWAEEKAARSAALRATQQFRQQSKEKRAPGPGARRQHPAIDQKTRLLAARLQAETLKRKAEKAQRNLEAAEAALRDGTEDAVADAEDSDVDSLGTISDSSALTDVDNASDSSDTDDDGPPQAQSSKVQVSSCNPRQSCVSFARTGRCRFGSKCRYSHDPSSRPSVKDQQRQGKPTRKGLYQVMVEKEQEEERKMVLSAIISLGKQGLLDEDK